METSVRRYDLDWLRVIVFALLILYHVGMFFVPWGFHLKNNIIYEWLVWPMLFLNQWRLPILFVISGMGTYYAFSKRSLKQYSWERVLRLGIPLIFGMLLIVPPQVYFERIANGQFMGSYFEFYSQMFNVGPYPEGDISWHHLWFLPYLLIFSLALGPVFRRLKRGPSKLVSWVKRQLEKPFGLYLFVPPLYLCEAFLEPFFPVTHALVGDWFNICISILFFFFGFLLIASGDLFWTALDRIKHKALALGIFCFLAQVFIWLFLEDGYVVHFTEALLKVTNIWSWILVLFTYGATYLNRKSKTVTYANRAVYPFYILHQTVTIAIAFYIKDLDWGFLPKALVLVVGTFGISWFIYHFLILKIKPLQPLFGVKK